MAKRQRGTGSLYQQPGSSNWSISYSLNGKQQRESTGTPNKRLAESFLKRRLTAVAGGNFLGAAIDRITVTHIMDDLLRKHHNDGKSSIADDERRWKLHLQPFCGHLRISQVTTDLLSRYVEQRKKEAIEVGSRVKSGEFIKHKTNRYPTNASLNRELALLRSAYYLGYKSTPPKVSRVPHFPMLDESGNVRKGFLKDEQYDKLADECGKVGLWLRAMFEVYYSYAWRKNEILSSLRVRQLDFMNRTIRIDDSKNGDGRTVVMTSKVYELLSACVTGKGQDDYVFTRKDKKKPIKDFRKTWKNVCEAAGCPALYVHDLRRTGCRNLRRLGVDTKVIMKIGGWKTDSVFRRYNIVDEADLAEAAAKLDAKRERLDVERKQESPTLEEQQVAIN